jgi:hypothetical protein
MGFDEPMLLLRAYGMASAGPAPARGRHRRVANKRVLARHIVSAARGTLTELDYPNVGRLAHIAGSCRDLIRAKDSVFDWRDPAGSVRFHLRNLQR